MVMNSISVTADAFNNLSDAGSSIITLIGFRISGQKPDPEHPFGHGRIEYIAALVVAFLVLEIGFTFFKEAIGKIRDPQEMNFQMVSVVILILSIGVKLWLGGLFRFKPLSAIRPAGPRAAERGKASPNS